MPIIEIIFLSLNALICVGATAYLVVNSLKMRSIEKAIIQCASETDYNSAKQKFPTHVEKRMEYLAAEGKIKDSPDASRFVSTAKNNAIALRFIVVTILIVLVWKLTGRL